jgi:hypothetical protein
VGHLRSTSLRSRCVCRHYGVFSRLHTSGGHLTVEARFAFAMLTLETHALINLGLLKIVQAEVALKHRRLYSPSRSLP